MSSLKMIRKRSIYLIARKAGSMMRATITTTVSPMPSTMTAWVKVME